MLISNGLHPDPSQTHIEESRTAYNPLLLPTTLMKLLMSAATENLLQQVKILSLLLLTIGAGFL
jgi:hypothetical protein